MAQLTDGRAFQRSSLTGGAAGKGSGVIPVAATLDATAATIEYRVRDASTSAVVQDWTQAATNVAAGARTINCGAVPARLGWSFIDLRANGGAAQLGTSRVAMGRGVAMAGQSQAVRQFGRMPSYTGTNASLGVTIDPNSAVYARYTDSSRTVSTPAWLAPADGGPYDSTFVAEFLRRQVEASGVFCFAIGHAVGSTAIASWQPGQQNYGDLAAVLDAVGGFEAFFWHQGGDDASAGTSEAAYKTGLSGIFNDLANHNAARGGSFERYVCAMATRTASGAGTVASVTAIRKAASDWASTNSATYLEPHDITLEDAVHQGQPGNITLARHLYRATRPSLGLTRGDNGPLLASATRATGSANVVLGFTMPSGTALASVGSPHIRFQAFAAGSMTSPLAIASGTVDSASNTLTLALSTPPANDVALDIWAYLHPDPSGTTAFDNGLYDNGTDGDGITRGRHVTPSRIPVTAAAPGGGASAPTPTPSSSLVDEFTGTNGSALAAHTSDSGHTWSMTDGTFLLADGSTYGSTAPANAVSSFVPDGTGYTIKADLIPTSNIGHNALVRFRIKDSSNYFYAGRGDQSDTWIVGRTINGAATNNIVQATGGVVAGRTYALEIRVPAYDAATPGNIEFLVDGVLIGTVPDNSSELAAKGAIGFRNSLAAATATTGSRFSRLTVTNP